MAMPMAGGGQVARLPTSACHAINLELNSRIQWLGAWLLIIMHLQLRTGAMGAESLAAALVENQALQTLDLHGNPLGPQVGCTPPQGAPAIGRLSCANATPPRRGRAQSERLS